MKLTIELVPSTSWFTNVRSLVKPNEWDKLRTESYLKAKYRCEICNGIGKKHPVECHEIWEYNDETREQKLIGLISLCPKCHQVKHAGFAIATHKGNEVVQQLMLVNGMTKKEANDYIEKSFELWRERSKVKWNVNIDLIKDSLKEKI
jgi:hypothetical protein